MKITIDFDLAAFSKSLKETGMMKIPRGKALEQFAQKAVELVAHPGEVAEFLANNDLGAGDLD